MRLLTIVSLCLLMAIQVLGQEFFINAESASTLPKGSIMPQFTGGYYDEAGIDRLMASAGINVGITSNLTMRAAFSGSNHHGDQLPKNIVSHNHGGSTTNVLIFNPGEAYDFKITGLNLFAKYRFLTMDKKKEHLRIASYLEYSTSKSPHDESEPNLTDDNSGYGFGIIATQLKGKFALSTTIGYVNAFDYKETSRSINKRISYGKTFKYVLSAGYLLYPKKYDSYAQTNYNLYLELVGKSFDEIQFFEDAERILLIEPAHQAGNYIEIHPGVQRIVNSNSILELSAGFRFIGRSYSHANPVFKVSWRKVFYL